MTKVELIKSLQNVVDILDDENGDAKNNLMKASNLLKKIVSSNTTQDTVVKATRRLIKRSSK